MISSLPKLISDMHWMNHDWKQVISCKIPHFLTTSSIITQKPHKSSHLAFSFWFFYQRERQIPGLCVSKNKSLGKMPPTAQATFLKCSLSHSKTRHELKPMWNTWMAHLNALWNFPSLTCKQKTTHSLRIPYLRCAQTIHDCVGSLEQNFIQVPSLYFTWKHPKFLSCCGIRYVMIPVNHLWAGKHIMISCQRNRACPAVIKSSMKSTHGSTWTSLEWASLIICGKFPIVKCSRKFSLKITFHAESLNLKKKTYLQLLIANSQQNRNQTFQIVWFVWKEVSICVLIHNKSISLIFTNVPYNFKWKNSNESLF